MEAINAIKRCLHTHGDGSLEYNVGHVTLPGIALRVRVQWSGQCGQQMGYELIVPGIRNQPFSTVLWYCSVHGHISAQLKPLTRTHWFIHMVEAEPLRGAHGEIGTDVG